MKTIINENYQSIVNRGLITPETTERQFYEKLMEEVIEYRKAVFLGIGKKKEELADVILVCLNIAKHYNIDIEKELINKIEINKKRSRL